MEIMQLRQGDPVRILDRTISEALSDRIRKVDPTFDGTFEADCDNGDAIVEVNSEFRLEPTVLLRRGDTGVTIGRPLPISLIAFALKSL